MDNINLGRFVRVRERQDGTHHVFFSVPQGLRPEGWPANITLPEEGTRIGSLKDPKFLLRIRKAANVLNTRLDDRREHNKIYGSKADKSTRTVAEIYFRTKRYRDLSESRKYRNARDAMIVVNWAEGRGNPDFSTFTKADFEDLLAIYDDRKSAQLDLRSILNVLCKEAIEAHIRPDNPAARLPWTAPRPKHEPVLWKGDLPQRYAEMARQMSQPGLAALIEIGVVIGQRLKDLRLLKHEIHYRNGRIRYKQSKTGARVSINLTRQQIELIESIRQPDSPYVFNDWDTQDAFSHSRLYQRFSEIRYALTRDGEPKLQLRTIRHTAVCNMIDNKVPLRMISAVTGHCSAQLNAITERYAVDPDAFADEAMKIVNRGAGGDDSDFAIGDLDRDWRADEAPVYRRPPASEARPGRYLGAALGQHRLRYTAPSEWWDDAGPE